MTTLLLPKAVSRDLGQGIQQQIGENNWIFYSQGKGNK